VLDTDTRIEPALAEDDEPARFTTRRAVRWAVILAIGIVVVLAIWQEPLHAGGR
jgi:ferric-dicitrate binding protein FerR (iron transport regulator)